MVPLLALVLPLLVAGGEPSIGDHMHTPQVEDGGNRTPKYLKVNGKITNLTGVTNLEQLSN